MEGIEIFNSCLAGSTPQPFPYPRRFQMLLKYDVSFNAHTIRIDWIKSQGQIYNA